MSGSTAGVTPPPVVTDTPLPQPTPAPPPTKEVALIVIALLKDTKKAQKIEKKEQKQQQRLIKKNSAEEVVTWILELGLPPSIAEKYVKIFKEESIYCQEIYCLAQVKKLTSDHLHEWMGVKTGTVLLMLEAINELEVAPETIKSVLRSRPDRAPDIPREPPAGPTLEEQVRIARKQDKETKKAEKEARRQEKRELKWQQARVYDQYLDQPIVQQPVASPRTESRIAEPIARPARPYSPYNPSGEEGEEEIFQAGGHGDVERTQPGFVRKRTDNAECKFYLDLQVTTLIPPHIKKFFATLESIQKKNDGIVKKKFVVMEDLTFGYKKPCIMDMKMGTRTAGKDANMVKKKYMISKDQATTTSTIGMRIVASRKYDAASGNYMALSRNECNSISTAFDLEKQLREFFYNGIVFRYDVIRFLIKRLTILKEWFDAQTAFRFFSSSLLVVYEGDHDEPFRADVRMIDFAHVSEIKDGTLDDGYLKGLNYFLMFLNKYAERAREYSPDYDEESSDARSDESGIVNTITRDLSKEFDDGRTEESRRSSEERLGLEEIRSERRRDDDRRLERRSEEERTRSDRRTLEDERSRSELSRTIDDRLMTSSRDERIKKDEDRTERSRRDEDRKSRIEDESKHSRRDEETKQERVRREDDRHSRMDDDFKLPRRDEESKSSARKEDESKPTSRKDEEKQSERDKPSERHGERLARKDEEKEKPAKKGIDEKLLKESSDEIEKEKSERSNRKFDEEKEKPTRKNDDEKVTERLSRRNDDEKSRRTLEEEKDKPLEKESSERRVVKVKSDEDRSSSSSRLQRGAERGASEKDKESEKDSVPTLSAARPREKEREKSMEKDRLGSAPQSRSASRAKMPRVTKNEDEGFSDELSD